MKTRDKRPLSYWVTVARMGFENDLHRLIEADPEVNQAELARRTETSEPHVSKILHGASGNYQIETMVKFARALGAILQIRLVRDGKEVVRVVDYETAAALDDALAASPSPQTEEVLAEVIDLSAKRDEMRARVHDIRVDAGNGRLEVGGNTSG